jgi:hypothetical protein
MSEKDVYLRNLKESVRIEIRILKNYMAVKKISFLSRRVPDVTKKV